MKRTLTLIALLALAATAFASQAEYPAAPAFSVKDLNGKVVDSDLIKGKIAVVNFWGTWCPPCREEIPDFVAFYEANKAKGLEIIGFAVEQGGPEGVKDFSTRHKMTYRLAMADPKLIKAFNVGDYIPATYIIDKKGRIRHKQVGLVDRKTLDDWFKKLTAEG